MKELNQIELFAKDHESITKEEKELRTKLIIGAKNQLLIFLRKKEGKLPRTN